MTYDEIPRTGDELQVLTAFLEWQRETLQRKCDGLDEAQLRLRSAPPSTMSLLGLVRHLADDERAWFRRTLAGEEIADRFSTEEHPDADFDDLDAAGAAEVFAAWREECERARGIVASHGLDDEGVQRTGRRVSMRWILVHMIEEYSRHNGHADLIRQRIDGATGY